MGRDTTPKIEFLPDCVGSALRAARATSLRIGDWSADGVEVMRSISFVLRHGITAAEFLKLADEVPRASEVYAVVDRLHSTVELPLAFKNNEYSIYRIR